MPLHVAMHNPNARVVGLESHDGVAGWCNHHCVSLHWDRGEAGCIAVVCDGCMAALVLVAWDVDTRTASNELHYVAMHIWALLAVCLKGCFEQGTYGSDGRLHQCC